MSDDGMSRILAKFFKADQGVGDMSDTYLRWANRVTGTTAYPKRWTP